MAIDYVVQPDPARNKALRILHARSTNAKNANRDAPKNTPIQRNQYSVKLDRLVAQMGDRAVESGEP